MTEAKPQRRSVPQSELDLVLMTTDSVWGKSDVSQEIRDKLNRYYKTKDKDGVEGFDVQSLWGLLGYYTRDMRLSNLSVIQGDYEEAKYYLDLAGDFLHAEMIEPFIICLSRVATILELSQSKGGFLRRRMGTFTQESSHQEMEPPKKNLFGVGKNKERL